MSNNKIFGINPVTEALKARRPLQRLFIAEQRKSERDIQAILRLAREQDIEIRFVSRDFLTHDLPNAVHQGVVAVTSPTSYKSLDDIMRIPQERNEPALFLLLDGVEDPRNLGAVLRTAEASGVHGIIIPERRAASLNETVAKTAAGALEYVPVVRVTNFVNTIEELKKNGIWIAGAEAGAGMSYWNADFSSPTALVLGGEGKGIRRLVKDHCDYLISLPLRGNINSLNVSVAAGVLLYEVLRQRTS
ncbi:MAG: 23S rRNA (guanosine(2251)-2'-O)-methyltransferase RlmB [Nitrospirota bacterium]